MFADNRQISHRQLFRQLILGQLGIYLITVPATPYITGRQGMLCLLVAGILFIPASIFLIRIRPAYQQPERYMGRGFGRLFQLLHVSYLFVTGVFLMLVITNVAERYFIEGSIPWMILVLSGVVCYLGSHQGLERRGRMAEVCFPVLVFVLCFLLAFSVARVEPAYLQIQGTVSGGGVLQGCYRLFCTFLPVFFLPAALGNVEKPSSSGKVLLGSFFLILAFLVSVLLLLQGAFGVHGYSQLGFPLFDLMAGVDLPGAFFERIDIFWIAAILFCVLFSLGTVFFYNHELLFRANMQKGAPFVAGAMVFAAVLCRQEKVSVELYGMLLRYFFAPVLLLLCMIAGFSCRRGKHHEKTQES